MGRNAKYSSSFFFVIKVDITRGKRIDNRKEDLNFPSDNSHAVFRTRFNQQDNKHHRKVEENQPQ
jgi:hypothetical protein